MYDYKKAMCDDIREYMEDNREDLEGMDRTGAENYLNEVLWTEDSVTGNGSGSYTFSRFQAKQNFFEDDDAETYFSWAIDEFGIPASEIAKRLASSDWEWVDVTIRCYLLGECLSEVLDKVFCD